MNAPREMTHAWKQDPHGPGSLLQFCEAVILPSRVSDTSRRKCRGSIKHLETMIKRPPSISDLNSENMRLMIARLAKLGLQRKTVSLTKARLVKVAIQAVQHELLLKVPSASLQCWLAEVAKFDKSDLGPKAVRPPFEIGEVNRLLASARTLPGEIAGISSHKWWAAMLLVLLDTETSFKTMVMVQQTAFDRERGVLSAGMFQYRLHPFARDAMNQFCIHTSKRLFPWIATSIKSFSETWFKRLLFRAIRCQT